MKLTLDQIELLRGKGFFPHPDLTKEESSGKAIAFVHETPKAFTYITFSETGNSIVMMQTSKETGNVGFKQPPEWVAKNFPDWKVL